MIGALIEEVEFKYVVDHTQPSHLTLVYAFLKRVPNLQRFYFLSSSCYTEILSALLDSKLPKLKSITNPDNVEDWKNYTNCVILAKYHLEQLLLTDAVELTHGDKMVDSVYYNRLYQRLPDFKNLTRIDIVKKTKNIIVDLDLIIENCSTTLQEICLTLPKSYNDKENAEATLECIPRSNIENVSLSFPHLFTCNRLLPYINHKFPHLKKLIISIGLDHTPLLNQFLVSLSWVKDLFIRGTFTIPGLLFNNIELLDESKKVELFEYVHVEYSSQNTGLHELRWEKKHFPSNSRVLRFVIHAYYEDMWPLYPFLEEFGSKIKVLNLKFVRSTPSRQLVFGKTLPQLLDHCPSLLKLTLQSYDFKKEELFFIGEQQIQHLEIKDSEIYQKPFESMFNKVPCIKHLEFNNVKFFDYNGNRLPYIYVGLHNTHIGELTVDLNCTKSLVKEKPRYVFLIISVRSLDQCQNGDFRNRSVDNYHKYDFETMNDKRFKPIEAKEYNEGDNSWYIYFGFSCKSVNQVNVIYDNVTLAL